VVDEVPAQAVELAEEGRNPGLGPDPVDGCGEDFLGQAGQG